MSLGLAKVEEGCGASRARFKVAQLLLLRRSVTKEESVSVSVGSCVEARGWHAAPELSAFVLVY